MRPLLYTTLLFVLCFSCSLFAQDYQAAHWQYLDGGLVEGEVRIPAILLIKETQIALRQKDQPLLTENIDFLVSNGDTLLLRHVNVYRENALYHRVFSGAFSIYRPLGKRSSNNLLVRRTPNGPLQPIQHFLWEISKENPELTTDESWEKANGNFNRTLLLAETIHRTIAPQEAFHSPLIQENQWSWLASVNTPLNTRLLSSHKQQYWGLYLGADKKLRRIAREVSLRLGLQLSNYTNRSNLEWERMGVNNNFDQFWKLAALQSYVGLNFNLLPNRKLSPFFGGGMTYLFPLRHKRELTSIGEVSSANFPIFLSVEGGIRPSVGLFYNLGLSYRWNYRFTISGQIARDIINLKTNFRDLNDGTRSLLRSQDIRINAGNLLRMELLVFYKLEAFQ